MMSIEEIIQTILGVAITIVVPYLVAYIKTKQKNAKFDQAMVFAKLAVNLVEQLYSELDGELKYIQASTWLSKRLAEAGIELSDEAIRGLIEATLKQIKSEYDGEFEEGKLKLKE